MFAWLFRTKNIICCCLFVGIRTECQRNTKAFSSYNEIIRARARMCVFSIPTKQTVDDDVTQMEWKVK